MSGYTLKLKAEKSSWACLQHSDNACFDWNSLKYSGKIVYANSDCVCLGIPN